MIYSSSNGRVPLSWLYRYLENPSYSSPSQYFLGLEEFKASEANRPPPKPLLESDIIRAKEVGNSVTPHLMYDQLIPNLDCLTHHPH